MQNIAKSHAKSYYNMSIYTLVPAAYMKSSHLVLLSFQVPILLSLLQLLMHRGTPLTQHLQLDGAIVHLLLVVLTLVSARSPIGTFENS